MNHETFLMLRGYAAEVLGAHLAGTAPDAWRDMERAKAIAQQSTLTAAQVCAAILLSQAAAMRQFSAPIKTDQGDIPPLDRDEYALAARGLRDAAKRLAVHLPPGPAAELLHVAEPTPSASAGTPKKWTPERLADLHAYREQYGTKTAAKNFGISEARVRKLLPRKAKLTGYNVFNQRSK